MTAAAAQTKSEPNGDHHLLFVDLSDSEPAVHRPGTRKIA